MPFHTLTHTHTDINIVMFINKSENLEMNRLSYHQHPWNTIYIIFCI